MRFFKLVSYGQINHSNVSELLPYVISKAPISVTTKETDLIYFIFKQWTVKL